MLLTTFFNTAKLALTLFICLLLSNAHSQKSLTQTVRGTIKYANNRTPLIGATIIVEEIEIIKGATAKHCIVKTKKQYNV